jgi:protoporphyrinogen oxidase
MKTLILGAGLAGVLLASELDGDVEILEKNSCAGGLCRSFKHGNIMCDIGPHILFSKNEAVLAKLLSCTSTEKIRRSNQILHKGRRLKYPFENDLASLSQEDCEYCLKEFIDNPYSEYKAENMLQFFLKTFGEGITRLYLQPYNEKIWKFDPAFMDVQMVERIPKPPKEDILKSARGESTEGYLHQLFFNYPVSGGIQSIINGCIASFGNNINLHTETTIRHISGNPGGWKVETDNGTFKADRIVNAMPMHELGICLDIPEAVQAALGSLQYNSIYLIALSVTKDNIGDNFAFFIADKDVVFHRLSKMNFLGDEYRRPDGGSTLLAEITYRPESGLATVGKDAIVARVIADLERLGLVAAGDILETQIKTEKYAYVIYDIDHARNKTAVVDHFRSRGIESCGRFAEFEYYNMDKVAESAMALAKKLNSV